MALAINNRTVSTTPSPKASLWIGRVLIGVIAAFIVLDATMHLARPAPVIQSFGQLGWPIDRAPILAIIEIALVVLLVLPRTRLFGAAFLTAYLGGATATHLRVTTDLFPVLFPAIFCSLLWTGLYLRDPRVRALVR